MPPNGKEQSVPPDELDNLPMNIIDEILMCLPLRDAARTSILSKKWRYNWYRFPQLTLDQTLWETRDGLIDRLILLVKIICHLLAYHEGPIIKLSLFIPYQRCYPMIDDLIYFLSGNGIQHLVLHNPYDHLYKLPSSFFACLELRHLNLKKCLICPPPAFKGFDRLISLELNDVTISSEFLGSLISHCSLLEYLVLEQQSNNIEINASKLRSFIFKGDIHFIHLKNVPLLTRVVLVESKKGKHSIPNFFESIPALEHLHWEHSTLQYSIAEVGEVPIEAPTRLSSALNCLKSLHLYSICMDELAELSCVLCLIRSSPYLQELDMEVYTVPLASLRNPVTDDYVDEIPASFSDVMMNHLRTVNLKGISGTNPEMQLLKILSAKSPALVRMVINPHIARDKKPLEVVSEITKLYLVSSKVEIVCIRNKRRNSCFAH